MNETYQYIHQQEFLADFDRTFSRYYSLLYDLDQERAGYELVHCLARFADTRLIKIDNALLQDFVQFRGDLITSDREAAAFALASMHAAC